MQVKKSTRAAMALAASKAGPVTGTEYAVRSRAAHVAGPVAAAGRAARLIAAPRRSSVAAKTATGLAHPLVTSIGH